MKNVMTREESLGVTAASMTVEALMFSLRRGMEALKKPDTQRRLSELNGAQLRELCSRLQNFRTEIAPAWTPDEVRKLIAIWKGVHA